jgi:hypothetical protein
MSSEYGILMRKPDKPSAFALGLNTRVTLIINNFYDEYNGDSLYFSNLLFLGIEPGPINLLHFKMENGKHIKRQIGDTMHYVKSKSIVYDNAIKHTLSCPQFSKPSMG